MAAIRGRVGSGGCRTSSRPPSRRPPDTRGRSRRAAPDRSRRGTGGRRCPVERAASPGDGEVVAPVRLDADVVRLRLAPAPCSSWRQMTDSELLQPPKMRTYPDEVYAPLSGSNDSPSPKSSSLMSPDGLFDSDVDVDDDVVRQPAAQPGGVIVGVRDGQLSVRDPVRVRGRVPVAPSSARSKSSVNGASMVGTLARQAGRGQVPAPGTRPAGRRASQENTPPASFPASGVRRLNPGISCRQTPADAAVADPDLGRPRPRPRCGPGSARREDDVGAARIEADHRSRSAWVAAASRAISRPRSAREAGSRGRAPGRSSRARAPSRRAT